MAVGHSLWFRSLICLLSENQADGKCMVGGKNLCVDKIPNAGCVALDIEFTSHGYHMTRCEAVFGFEKDHIVNIN